MLSQKLSRTLRLSCNIKATKLIFILSLGCSVIFLYFCLDTPEIIKVEERFYQLINFHETKIKNKDNYETRNIIQKLREREELLQKYRQISELYENSTEKRFPSIIGIGTMKCGTAGTIEFLKQHPLVKLPNVRKYETFFFNYKNESKIEFYRNLFPMLKPNEITAEKTPEYFDNLPINLPETVRKALPKVKIMLNVCDPVDRAFSNFLHRNLNKQQNIDKYETFDKYIEIFLPFATQMMKSFHSSELSDLDIEKELNGIYRLKNTRRHVHILTKGLYYYHILRWFKFFNRSEIFIIDGEEFLKNPGPIMEDLQDFIGIPKLLLKEDFVKNKTKNFFCYKKMDEKYLNNLTNHNTEDGMFCLGDDKGRSRNGMRVASKRAKELLTKFYEPYNEKFFQLLGRNFSWSNKQ